MKLTSSQLDAGPGLFPNCPVGSFQAGCPSQARPGVCDQDDRHAACRPPALALHPSYWPHLCPLYLAEFVEQFRNASQPLLGPLVVPVLEHHLHHLRVPSADRLLQDWGHQAAEGCSLHGPRSGHSPTPCHPLKEARLPAAVPAQPWQLSLPTLALCRRRTLTDSRFPRETASSSGVRPRGSSCSMSCWGRGDTQHGARRERQGKRTTGLDGAGSRYMGNK